MNQGSECGSWSWSRGHAPGSSSPPSCASLLVATGAALGAHRLITGSDDEPPASTPAPSAAASSDAPPASGPGRSTWQRAATAYGRAFTNTRGGRDAWLERLEDLVSPDLAQGYTYTDLTAVPQARFVRFSGGQDVAGQTPSRAVRLHYTAPNAPGPGLLVDVTISQAPGTGLWVVTTAVPVEPDQTPKEQI